MLLKMNWNGSDLSLDIEEDTGTSIAHSMTTVISQLFVSMMGGFAVSQAVLGDTSTPYLDMKYAPTLANAQMQMIMEKFVIGQTSGSVSMCWNPMSREWTTTTSTDSDGVGSQEGSESHQESSSHTSTQTERRSSSSRFGTLTEALAVLRSHRVVDQQFMERSV